MIKILIVVWEILKIAIPVASFIFAVVGIFASDEHWYFIAGIVMGYFAGNLQKSILLDALRGEHHSWLSHLVELVLGYGSLAMIIWGGVRWLA